MEVKKEYDKADKLNGKFFISKDCSDEVEREYNIEDESVRDLGWSGDSQGSTFASDIRFILQKF